MNTTPFRFEVGEVYWSKNSYQQDYKVIKKTNCFVWVMWYPSVSGSEIIIQKKLKYDIDGNEYIAFSRKDIQYWASGFNVWAYHKWVDNQRAKLELA